ncbi:hypothetical protein GCM10027093_05320 [Paraburkholderia jirisanensis]
MEHSTSSSDLVKFPFQILAIAVAIGAPVASFAPPLNQPLPKVESTTQNQAADQCFGMKANAGGYGASINGGTWEAGHTGSGTISAYSPPALKSK